MESLLPLLLFILFIALRAFASRKSGAQRREPLPEGESYTEEPEVEMDEALRQIREALGMPTPPPRPAPLPPPTPVQLPAPPPLQSMKPPARRSQWQQEWQTKPFVPGEKHVHVSRVAPPKPKARPTPAAGLFDSPADTRRAFLASEIFGRPRSQRPRDR